MITLNAYAVSSSFVVEKEFSTLSDGEVIVFSSTDQKTPFLFSEKYDAVGVKAPAYSIILVSTDGGVSWNTLSFNSDSKTEKDGSSLLYSDLHFLSTPSDSFQFQIKLAPEVEEVEFHFFVDQNPENTVYASAGIDYTPLSYSRDTWFLLKNGIIPRENWGAEEKYRYTWGNSFQSQPLSSHTSSVKTERAKECDRKVYAYPQDFMKQKVVSSDSNGTLVWPYQYSSEIKKVIIHHTADNNSIQEGRSPESIMRSIYTYHANTKGWGDIGYHFVIAPDGSIFEGKAGGDFVIGGHTYCGNTKTLGVALMGNFEETTPPEKQLKALYALLKVLSEKYNIDLSGSNTFHGIHSSTLLGHQDFVSTACPGKTMYELLPSLRTLLAGSGAEFSSLIVSPPYNPTILSPELSSSQSSEALPTPSSSPPLSPLILNGQRVPYTVVKPPTRTVSSTPLPTLEPNFVQEPNIRIRLGYNSDMVQIRGEMMEVEINSTAHIRKKSRVTVVYRGGQLYLNEKPVQKVRITEINDDGVLKIASWKRPLEWDPLQDDNEFRGTLEIRVINGEMVVINELLLEDYLKGIAEVSNSAPFEKQKAIAVVARTYAQFYTLPGNHKYPGMPYHGDDSPESFQKYRGYGYEKRSPLFVQAVQDTQGQVVQYQGNIVKTPFFSESDGHTKSAQSVWGWTHTPYLKAKNDSFCKNGQGTQNGHGVGMSGCGAETMAQMGYSYIDILKYYYEGVEIE